MKASVHAVEWALSGSSQYDQYQSTYQVTISVYMPCKRLDAAMELCIAFQLHQRGPPKGCNRASFGEHVGLGEDLSTAITDSDWNGRCGAWLHLLLLWCVQPPGS